MNVKEIFQEDKKIQEPRTSAEQKLSHLSVFDMEQLMQCPCNTVLFFKWKKKTPTKNQL